MCKNKVALVTGGGRGIGHAAAIALAKEGADVAVNYSGSREMAEQTVREICALGRRAVAVQADVGKEEDCIRMFSKVKDELGSIDVLVNNAGITRDNLAVRMSEDEFMQVINTNLKGAFLCMKLAGKEMMKKRYGRIINISSISGVHGNARTDQLLCRQGGTDRNDKVLGTGVGFAWCDSKRSCPWIY